LFFVKSLETEAVAWEVLVSGNVGGAKSRGGGRILEPVVEFDNDREAESCLSLSITNAWSSIKIFLNDVTAKFVCESLSEELLAEGISSIGGVRGFDGKTGVFN